MLWLLSGHTGVSCWISLAPVFSFIYCWVLIFALTLFLYLDLYVLVDYALISKGSFMQTKHLCVLIHIWTKGDVGAPLNRFKSSSKIFLLTLPRGYFFCGSFMFFWGLVLAMPLCVSVYMCLVVTWPLDSRLWCLIVSLSLSHWYPGSGVVLNCIDSWSLHP